MYRTVFNFNRWESVKTSKFISFAGYWYTCSCIYVLSIIQNANGFYFFHVSRNNETSAVAVRYGIITRLMCRVAFFHEIAAHVC